MPFEAFIPTNEKKKEYAKQTAILYKKNMFQKMSQSRAGVPKLLPQAGQKENLSK